MILHAIPCTPAAAKHIIDNELRSSVRLYRLSLCNLRVELSLAADVSQFMYWQRSVQMDTAALPFSSCKEKTI